MVERPTIPHFLAMVMDNINLEGQGRGSFKDLPRPFFLKSTLFTNMRPVLSQTKLGLCPYRIKMPTLRALKLGIVVFIPLLLFEKITEN